MERKDNRGRKLKENERQRADGRYEYRYVEPITGKRKSIIKKSLSDLRVEERQIVRDIEDGIVLSSELSKMTVNGLFRRHMEMILLEESTRSNYEALWKNHVENTIGKMKVVDVKPTHIRTFYAQLTKAGYAWGTIKIIHGILCPIFDMALEDDVIRKNPVKNNLNGYGVKPKEKAALSQQQQTKLFSFVKNSNCYSKYLPMLEIMVGTALRVGELAGLTWDDVNYETSELNIDHQIIYKNYGDGCKFHLSKPKTDAGIRMVPMTTRVRHALNEQRKIQFMLGIDHSMEVEGLTNFVFTSKSGMPLAPNAINNILYNIVNAYNKEEEQLSLLEHRNPDFIPKISAHSMRHTGCTRMAEAGMDTKVLQYIMGHADISVTMDVYNHITDMSRVKNEVQKLEKLVM